MLFREVHKPSHLQIGESVMIKSARLFLSLPVLAAVATSTSASEKPPDAKLAATLCATVSSASFQQNRNAINGVITDTSGRPINRIRVELLNEVEMAITQTYTDTTGRYNFRGLSTGTFIVKANPDGTYLGQSVRVSLFGARVGGSHYEQVDIVLKTRNETKGNSVPSNSGPTFAQEAPANARKAYEQAVKQLENNK